MARIRANSLRLQSHLLFGCYLKVDPMLKATNEYCIHRFKIGASLQATGVLFFFGPLHRHASVLKVPREDYYPKNWK